MINLYIVGDSTLASFKDDYYYPRYGYGTKIKKYFNDDINVINIAISGRSSKSYLKDKEYPYLVSNIKKGDYLIIGFGHNDEKDEDPNRFTSANLPVTDNHSFTYYLYNYYVKLAYDKGACPILCTPIVRADKNENYTSNSAHITKNGDYRKAIIDLGKNTNTTVIDLTTKTKKLYQKIKFDKAIYFHAWAKNNKSTVDTTHLNIYGADMVAYIFAKELAKTNNHLANYLKNDITEPNINDSLIANPDYIELPYKPFDKNLYNPTNNFKLNDDFWFATAFGDNGSNPLLESTGYFVKSNDNTYLVGQDGAYLKGRIGETEGIVFLFHQVPKEDNFIVSCNATVITKKADFESGFGLMLRDDIYTNQNIPDASILSNYVACGIYNDDSCSHILYSRENKTLKPSKYLMPYYKVGDSFKLTLKRLGQVVELTLEYKDKVYNKTYTDFDFFAIDTNYMYVGLYATKGTTIKFDDLSYTYLSKSQGA